jgi:phosphotransferase system enzyme I (PtsP)
MVLGPIIPMPRRLLARVRDVMAGAEAAQARLEQIASIIASDLVAEVCSIYVRRAGEVLELFATQGLKPEAVHRTRLRIGEGLIGDIAAHSRPMALDDAQSHPSFAFRPETGEEIYRSLMGVPILRGGRVLGVIAVQNKARRQYADEEVETLQTVAMVLAEMVASGELIDRDEQLPADGNALLPLRLKGARLSPGLAMGVAVLHQPFTQVRRLIADHPAKEHERLLQAVTEMHGALDDMINNHAGLQRGESREVIETYRMIAEDAGWLSRIKEAINSGLTAEAAVQRVQNDFRARMHQISDPYLRERVHDLEDLANRLLGHLGVHPIDAGETVLPDDAVLVARNMGPAKLLDFDRSRLRALILEEGSSTSHVAIVARALDIPVVAQLNEIFSKIESGDPILVDGDNAQIFIRPGEEIRQTFSESMTLRAHRRAAYVALRDLPAVTQDGTKIAININAGLLTDLDDLAETGADGVGLCRTEIPFMVYTDLPDVEAQAQIYGDIFARAEGKPVVFRTLDVGGDKVLPYWNNDGEENPAMGWRSIRISLDRPAVLRQQFRALLRAAGERDLHLMFPMISEVAEFDAARRLLVLELEREAARGKPFGGRLFVGTMLEVPSLVFQLPALLERVDFVSIGTNDLLQFLFASDRGNPRISERYDFLSPLVLTFLHGIRCQCDEAGVPVAVCGDMAGRPLEAMALAGIGFRNLSVLPSAVGPVKTMIRSLDLEPLVGYLDTLYGLPERSVREKLRSFATDHGVMI